MNRNRTSTLRETLARETTLLCLTRTLSNSDFSLSVSKHDANIARRSSNRISTGRPIDRDFEHHRLILRNTLIIALIARVSKLSCLIPGAFRDSNERSRRGPTLSRQLSLLSGKIDRSTRFKVHLRYVSLLFLKLFVKKKKCFIVISNNTHEG